MFDGWSFRARLVGGILLTCATVLALTCGTLLAYEWITFRQSMVANVSTLARVLAANSTAALAFKNPDDANTVLAVLATEPGIVRAGLYDADGNLFAGYARAGADGLPDVRPDLEGYRFSRDRLMLSEPVTANLGPLGALYLESDLTVLYRRLALYLGLIGVVMLLSIAVALALGSRLQQSVSRPVMALVDTAALVSEHRDYSARADKFANDELGRLTDTFNDMLARIESQASVLIASEERLRQEVAERTRAEAEVQALNADLERRVAERTAALETATKEMEAFSYSVSHDLRAPLRAITGFSRILLDDYQSAMPAEAASYLLRVSNGARRMGQLVDDLLAFSRLGRAPLQRRRVNPADVVADVLRDFEEDRRRPGLTLTVGDLPACEADPSLLKQAYVNLISNALKFTRGREHAEVTIGSEPSADGTVYFVKDNGAGFDMRYANKLFGVFQRLHRLEDFEGTGVGLAIVHRVITRHGGRIWADGAVDRGASFYFTLGDTHDEHPG